MKITKEHVFYSFTGNNAPAMTVYAPAQIDFETMDCFGNQLRNPEDVMEEID